MFCKYDIHNQFPLISIHQTLIIVDFNDFPNKIQLLHNIDICVYYKNLILISEKDTLPTIPTQQGQTIYIGLPIYFVECINLIRV